MKKKIVQTLVFTLLTSFAFGQKFDRRQCGHRRQMNIAHNESELKFRQNCAHIDGMLRQRANTYKQQGHSSDRNTTEIAERMIANSFWSWQDTSSTGAAPADTNEVFMLQDTTIYTYSGGRSSIFNYNHMNYDPIFYLDGSEIMGFGGDIGFPDPNNQPTILFDSSLTWYLNYVHFDTIIIDSMSFGGTQIAYYDSSYNVTEYANLYLMDTMASYYMNKNINTYNSLENIASTLTLEWDYGIWDTMEYRTFIYDSRNLVIEDSTGSYWGGGVWQPLEKWNYTYDDSGNMIQAVYYYDSAGIWQEQQYYYMTYYPDHKLHTDSIAKLTFGIWQPREKDTFFYTSGIDFVTTEDNWASDGIAVTTLFSRVKHLNSLNEPDTFYYYLYDTGSAQYVNYGKDAFTYDSYGEPVYDFGFKYVVTDTATFTGYYDSIPSYVNHYYYQTYFADKRSNSHTGVENIPSNSFKLSVFPNPSNNELYVKIPGYPAGANIMLTLVDAAGQRVRTEALPWLQDTENFPMGGLAPGNYWLLAQDNKGNTLGRQQVVKE